MFANLFLMLSMFISFIELDSLKEKIKPQLFINKSEILDYPDDNFIIFIPQKMADEKNKKPVTKSKSHSEI